jgi:hypothetical protein
MSMSLYTTVSFTSYITDWGKIKEDIKIAKLPKVVRLKNGDRIYLK